LHPLQEKQSLCQTLSNALTADEVMGFLQPAQIGPELDEEGVGVDGEEPECPHDEQNLAAWVIGEPHISQNFDPD